MIFEKAVRIPGDRVAVLIGRSGSTKAAIEESCGVDLDVDGETGEVAIRGDGGEPFKAVGIVSAIGRGFSPESAMDLLDDSKALHVIDLREYAGRSPRALGRIRARLIGERGRARRNLEGLSGTRISVYGRTVSIIGAHAGLRLAADAVASLSSGSVHGSVYGRLEAANRRKKAERMRLWE
ncbi:MAG: KH domain-containing protein [Nitrosopumilus sp.]|nr:KH domain-containing protein [Nitrosopumilus sp.]CAI9832118.1 KH domain protein [Nitrosopumilaceae archaeon]MDA7941384.1 KH domain-containing protein [Nitrosopumilus sp.]MDA7942792.1 KH domain-containing protein [Nitrosopumilus sp.]MDA7945078.1 KH domain-containing protein [Nitrosopumilus sp.]